MPIKFNSIDEEAPKIEFPCAYPVKIIGQASERFAEDVIRVMERHAGDVPSSQIKHQTSRKGNYISITVTIQATGEQQLAAIFLDLKKVDGVKVVL